MKRFFVFINDPFLVVCIHVDECLDEKIEFYRDLDSLEQLDFLSRRSSFETTTTTAALYVNRFVAEMHHSTRSRLLLHRRKVSDDPTCTCTRHAFDD